MEQDFKKGQVIKMAVGPRSHVTKPYYVQVMFYNPKAKFLDTIMITDIPGQHRLDMFVGKNWEYHKPRMTIVGTVETHGHLLHNQPLD